MDVDKILEKISVKIDKDKKYLKGLYNKAKKDLEDQFGDALNEDRLSMLSLIRVGKGYGIDKEQIDSMIADNVLEEDGFFVGTVDSLPEDVLDEVDDIIVVDDDEIEQRKAGIVDYEVDDMGFELEKEPVEVAPSDSWKDFMDDIPEPTVYTDDFERMPSLIIDLGCTYYLKMTDLENAPHEHEFDGTWGPYTKWAFKVKLIKISDSELYDKKYERGEFKDKLAYIDGQNYTMWLNEKERQYYAMFWKKLTANGLPDDRVFTYKKSKPGKYNVYKFALPKKR